MKKRIYVVTMTLIAALSMTACTTGKNSQTKNDKKQTSEDKKENDDQYSPIVAKDVKVKDSEYPYLIKVNKAKNCITVYTLDKDDEYTVPERAILCSVGKDGVPDGEFQIGDTVEWQMLTDGSYGRYVTRIKDDIVFRSVNYKAQSEDSLDIDSYNKLGDTIEDSAVVLSEADAQWISENCPEGTKVIVYEDEDSPGELGKPLARLISDKITWDPTDASSENAWYVPVSFFGVSDKTVKLGSAPDLMEGISAKDKYGNDLTASVKMYGEVDVNKAGEYKVTYSCENADGDKREVSAVVTVEGEETANESSSDNGKEAVANASQNTTEPSPEPTATPAQEPVVASAQTEEPVVTETPAAQNNAQQDTTVVTTVTTTRVLDTQPPVMKFIAASSKVSSIKTEYLRNRISVYDDGSGVDGVYISVCRIPGDGSYVVIYEAFDKDGNSSCISETVTLE